MAIVIFGVFAVPALPAPELLWLPPEEEHAASETVLRRATAADAMCFQRIMSGCLSNLTASSGRCPVGAIRAVTGLRSSVAPGARPHSTSHTARHARREVAGRFTKLLVAATGPHPL